MNYKSINNIPSFDISSSLGINGTYLSFTLYLQYLSKWLSDFSIRIIPSGVICTNSSDTKTIYDNIETQIYNLLQNDEFSIDTFKELVFTYFNTNIVHYTNCVMTGTGSSIEKDYGKTTIDLQCKFTGYYYKISDNEIIETEDENDGIFNTIIVLFDLYINEDKEYAKNIPLGIWYTTNQNLTLQIQEKNNFYSNSSSLLLDIYYSLSTLNWEENESCCIFVRKSPTVSEILLNKTLEKAGILIEKYLEWTSQQALLISQRRSLFISYQKQKQATSHSISGDTYYFTLKVHPNTASIIIKNITQDTEVESTGLGSILTYAGDSIYWTAELENYDSQYGTHTMTLGNYIMRIKLSSSSVYEISITLFYYSPNTLGDSSTSITPTLEYILYSYDGSIIEDDGDYVTISYSIDDITYFSINEETGEVTAGSETNIEIQETTVTVTVTYNNEISDLKTYTIYREISGYTVVISVYSKENENDYLEGTTIYYIYNISYSSSVNNPLTLTIPSRYYLTYYAECDGYITSTSTKIQILENKDIDIYLEEDYVTSVEVSDISLTYNSYTLSDTTTPLTPILTYTLTRTWASGDTDTITSGATTTWKITDTDGNDTDYFSIDSTGEVTAGSETNYDEDVSAVVIVTLSYSDYTLTGTTTTTATVYRTATEDSVNSTAYSSGSLYYSSSLDGTSYSDGDSISPELSYVFVDTYSSGSTVDVSSGATVTWKISDTTNFSIDASGNVTALSDNYSSTRTATVTATITYNGVSGSSTAFVTQTAATDYVTSVEVSDISLTYYSDEDLTTECSTLSSSVTTLYPKVTATVTVKTNVNTTGTDYEYDSTDSSCNFLNLGGTVSSYYGWDDYSGSYMSLDTSTGQVTYGTGILTSSDSESVIVTLTATYSEISSDKTDSDGTPVTASCVVGYLVLVAQDSNGNSIYGASAEISFDSDELSGSTSQTSNSDGTLGERLTYFMNVSNFNSGYEISATFSADGYEGVSAFGTITASNTTTLLVTLEEEESCEIYIYLTVNSPSSQTVTWTTQSFSGTGDPTYNFYDGTSEYEEDDTSHTISGSNCYWHITGLASGDSIDYYFKSAASGYNTDTYSGTISAGETKYITLTLSILSYTVSLGSVYIDWSSSSNTALQTAYLQSFSINDTYLVSSDYQIFKAESLDFASDSSQSGYVDYPTTTVSVTSGDTAKVEWSGYVKGYINSTTSTSTKTFSGDASFTITANKSLTLTITINSSGTVSSSVS